MREPRPAAGPGLALLRRAGRTPAQVLSTADLLQLLDTRPKIEDAIERLIALLDAVDEVTEDLEDDDPAEKVGDDEPSLGALGNLDQRHWCQGGDLFAIDLEDVNEDGAGQYDGPFDPYARACEQVGGVHV